MLEPDLCRCVPTQTILWFCNKYTEESVSGTVKHRPALSKLPLQLEAVQQSQCGFVPRLCCWDSAVKPDCSAGFRPVLEQLSSTGLCPAHLGECLKHGTAVSFPIWTWFLHGYIPHLYFLYWHRTDSSCSCPVPQGLTCVPWLKQPAGCLLTQASNIVHQSKVRPSPLLHYCHFCHGVSTWDLNFSPFVLCKRGVWLWRWSHDLLYHQTCAFF